MRFIRNINRYISKKLLNSTFIMYHKVEDNTILYALGFSNPLIENEQIIPNSSANKATHINSDGKEIIRRDLPKEKFYVYYNLELPNFGDYSRGTHTVSGSFERERYPREHTSPFCLNLILRKKDDEIYICSDELTSTTHSDESLALLINLFRFSFGDIPMMASDFIDATLPKVRKVEWELLRQGTREEIAKNILTRIVGKNHLERAAYQSRYEFVIKKSVDNVVFQGNNGFEGYFCVKTKSHFVMECIYTNNATYVLKNDDNWEEISQKTKLEVINHNLATRLYHTTNWEENLLNIID